MYAFDNANVIKGNYNRNRINLNKLDWNRTKGISGVRYRSRENGNSANCVGKWLSVFLFDIQLIYGRRMENRANPRNTNNSHDAGNASNVVRRENARRLTSSYCFLFERDLGSNSPECSFRRRFVRVNEAGFQRSAASRFYPSNRWCNLKRRF